MSSRFVPPFTDVGSGIKPPSGAQLFFLETGSSALKDTFSDQLSTPTKNSNPVIASSTGIFGDIFITGKYRVVLKDKNGSQIWEADPVNEFVTGSGQLVNVLSRDTLNDAVIDDSLQAGLSIDIKERTTGNGGSAKWDVVLASSVTISPGAPAVGNIVIGTGVPTLALVLRKSATGYTAAQLGVTGTGDQSPGLQALFDLGGNLFVNNNDMTLESQVNITVANTTITFESRAAKLIYGATNTANLLSLQTTGIVIESGTFDGNGLAVGVGSATEDGSLISVTANSEFTWSNSKITNVLGNNSTGLPKQALTNISNDGVVFDINNIDFSDCYILDAGGASQDAKFISFKGNTITTPTRGRIVGGSMIGVGTTLTSGVTTDKDGKCIRGFYSEVAAFEFDIEITGIYTTEFDEAFVKMTGMKGMNIHDNHVVGIFTNPWDAVVNQSQYFFRNVHSTGVYKGGSVQVVNNTVSGSFLKLVEVAESANISGNTFDIKDNGSEHLNVLYEITGSNVQLSGNKYKLETIDKIFNFTGTELSDSGWSSESLTFTLDGDEAPDGKRLIFSIGDITNFKASSITLDITTTNATLRTDLLRMTGQVSDGNITNLEFHNFKLTTDFSFGYLPNNTDNSSVISGVKYSDFEVTYKSAITLLGQPTFTAKTTKPTGFEFIDFDIKFNGLSASVTQSPIALDECHNTKIRRMTIQDNAPGAFTYGFLARFRGDAGDNSLNLDINEFTFVGMQSSQSRLIDINNSDIVRIEDVSFFETSTTGSKNGIQFTDCDNVLVGDVSANDAALTTWASLVDINSGDNYVVGKVNCRGTKVTFGTATNTVDNT